MEISYYSISLSLYASYNASDSAVALVGLNFLHITLLFFWKITYFWSPYINSLTSFPLDQVHLPTQRYRLLASSLHLPYCLRRSLGNRSAEGREKIAVLALKHWIPLIYFYLSAQSYRWWRVQTSLVMERYSMPVWISMKETTAHCIWLSYLKVLTMFSLGQHRFFRSWYLRLLWLWYPTQKCIHL